MKIRITNKSVSDKYDSEMQDSAYAKWFEKRYNEVSARYTRRNDPDIFESKQDADYEAGCDLADDAF